MGMPTVKTCRSARHGKGPECGPIKCPEHKSGDNLCILPPKKDEEKESEEKERIE